LKCENGSFTGDRDVTATVNLYRRFISHSRCGEPGVSLNAPKSDENPSGMQGKQNEAMNHINLYES